MESEFGKLTEQAALIAMDVMDAWMAIETKRGALVELLQRAGDAPFDSEVKARTIATWREMLGHLTTACEALSGRINSEAKQDFNVLRSTLNNYSGIAALPNKESA